MVSKSILLRFIVLLGFMSLGSTAFSQSCDNALQPSMDEFERMERVLDSISTQEGYRDEVKNRYDKVEVLLFMATKCSQNQELSEQELKLWNQTMRGFTALQASAKASAFTKFADWREAKQADVMACQAVNKAFN